MIQTDGGIESCTNLESEEHCLSDRQNYLPFQCNIEDDTQRDLILIEDEVIMNKSIEVVDSTGTTELVVGESKLNLTRTVQQFPGEQ